MERFIVEQGIAVKLLDIICNDAWPPSLRETAGGCLQLLAERLSNLNTFPEVELPHDIKWPLQVCNTKCPVNASLSYGST